MEEAKVWVETATWSMGMVGSGVVPRAVPSAGVGISGGLGIAGGTDVSGDGTGTVAEGVLVPLWLVVTVRSSGLGVCGGRAGSRMHCSSVCVQTGLSLMRMHWMRVEVPALRL